MFSKNAAGFFRKQAKRCKRSAAGFFRKQIKRSALAAASLEIQKKKHKQNKTRNKTPKVKKWILALWIATRCKHRSQVREFVLLPLESIFDNNAPQLCHCEPIKSARQSIKKHQPRIHFFTLFFLSAFSIIAGERAERAIFHAIPRF